MFDLFVIPVFVLSVAISVAITVPFTGALIRLRANYNPKGLQLDDDGNVQPHTGPVVTTFFGMLSRVKRIEGWGGLYKGLMPTLLETSVLTLFVVVALSADPRAHSRITPPDSGIVGTLIFAAFSIALSLPAVIISYRAVTTPYKLPYFRPIYSLRILLTPTERRRPWILYLSPGLFLAQFLHSAYMIIVLRSLRRLLVPTSEDDRTGFQIHPVKFTVYAAIAILSTLILCPLEVMITKLAVQRNHAAAEYNSVEQEVEPDAVGSDEYTEYSGADEDVIGLRHEKDPYLGLVDCARRVAQEEGWQALYRVWWLTMLVAVGSAFA